MIRKRMMKRLISIAALALATVQAFAGSWVRINQIGYLPSATKVAVFMSDEASRSPASSLWMRSPERLCGAQRLSDRPARSDV